MRRPARSEGGRVRELLQLNECGKTPPHAGGEEQLRRPHVVRFGVVRATPQSSQPSLLGPERPGSYEKWRAVLNHDECSMHAEFEAMTYPGITDLLRPGFDTIEKCSRVETLTEPEEALGHM